jgi:uncharacterized protein YjbI with pentapeptide repeats
VRVNVAPMVPKGPTDRDAAIWDRLLRGKSLEGLDLLKTDGRWDLSSLDAPPTKIVRRFFIGFTRIEEQSGFLQVRGLHWKDLSFSRCHLDSLRLFDTRIENCSFDQARCQGWRMWSSTFVNSTFRGADLRNASLGGVDRGKRPSFVNVDFSKADLRGSVHKAADMTKCTFAETKLDKVDFNGTIFEDCTFRGELNQVLFHRRAFKGEGFPPNEMKGVDFRRATFHYVEFRGLDMLDVVWPEDPDHMVLDEYPAALDRALAMLGGRSDNEAKALAAFLGVKRKWVGPGQQRGVLRRADLIEVAGPKLTAELIKTLSAIGERG